MKATHLHVIITDRYKTHLSGRIESRYCHISASDGLDFFDRSETRQLIQQFIKIDYWELNYYYSSVPKH